MKKRWTAALLALSLAVALTPVTAQGAQTDRTAGSRLSGADRTIYNELRTELAKIADGSRTHTTIHISDLSALSWTLEDLGLSADSNENARAKLEQKFTDSVHMSRILYALSVDCPYELYWADNQFSWKFSSIQKNGRASINDITVYFLAAEAYRDQGSPTSVSGSKVSAAQKALDNAKTIVEKYAAYSDYDKLNAYREEVCRLVSYDMATYQNHPSYGDPWQMIYVFDGDPDTNVVCEGYSKAFKYLCDLSDFDGDITCYITSGKMNNESHMWNVVRMGDGRHYIADVTNCDNGMIGEDDRPFLAGGTSRDGDRICSISNETFRAVYIYGEDQRDLLTNGYISNSGSNYDPDTAVILPPPQPDPSPAPSDGGGPDFTDVPADAYYAEPVAWAVEEGITDGTSNTTFSPGQPCTHGQILTFLWRAAGKPDSSGTAPGGVKGEDFFYDAVRWAAENGMLADGFDPRSGCSRADAVRYIWQAFQSPPAGAVSFTDVPDHAPYAGAVNWAVEKGVTNGDGSADIFSPDKVCNRGQIVTFLYRAYH